MKWVLAVAIIFIPNASHAGLVRRCCARALERLVMDDPHQYEEYATAWLERRRDQLEIAARWRELDKAERVQLALILDELHIRAELAKIPKEEF